MVVIFYNRLKIDSQMSEHMSDLLAIQDNLLKASAEELLRTDLLDMTTKGTKHTQGIFTEFLCFSSLSYWFTANSFAHGLEGSHESYQRIIFPIYTPQPHNWPTMCQT